MVIWATPLPPRLSTWFVHSPISKILFGQCWKFEKYKNFPKCPSFGNLLVKSKTFYEVISTNNFIDFFYISLSVHHLVHMLSQQVSAISQRCWEFNALLDTSTLTYFNDFFCISNNLGLVSGQQFYVCKDMPNYDIDIDNWKGKFNRSLSLWYAHIPFLKLRNI